MPGKGLAATRLGPLPGFSGDAASRSCAPGRAAVPPNNHLLKPGYAGQKNKYFWLPACFSAPEVFAKKFAWLCKVELCQLRARICVEN